MRKTAIFVEGQTELIFVREYLLRYFNWEVDIVCRKLVLDGNMEYAEFDSNRPNAGRHYQIINVQGDTAVLTRLLQREESLRKVGYETIIGLRDMFTEDYLKKSKTIDPAINQSIIAAFNKAIKEKAKQPDKITFCFAIMETEAWMIGLHEVLLKMNKGLDIEVIKTKIGIDIKQDDPETNLFQPSKSLDTIYGMFGESYKKKKGDVDKFMDKSTKEDFENLIKKPICSHFNIFHEAVLDNS